MVATRLGYATGPAPAPGEAGAVIRYGRDGRLELVNLLWGLAPSRPGGRPITHVRGLDPCRATRRCLIPASVFSVASGAGPNLRRWRVSLRSGDHFYLAGCWRPAQRDRAGGYALVTVPASPDIAPYQGRHVAVIRRDQRMAWLDDPRAAASLLGPHPRGTFRVAPIDPPSAAQQLFPW